MKILISLLILSACSSQKIKFRRPNIDPVESPKIIVPKVINSEEEIRKLSIEDDELEENLKNYYETLQTEKEKEFFDLGKKAVDLRIFFVWPLNSKSISSGYGYRNHPMTKKWHFHKGVDIRSNKGTPVFAAQSGKVIIKRKSKTYGNLIAIAHSKGFVTLYAHNSKILVNKGDKVSKNQRIALVGSTGLATGPHLHFEIRRYNKNIDPFQFMQNQKKYLKNK